MPIPSQSEMNLVVLKLMMDGAARTRSQAKLAVRDQLALAPEEQDLKTSSGVRVYESRVGWAVSNLA